MKIKVKDLLQGHAAEELPPTIDPAKRRELRHALACVADVMLGRYVGDYARPRRRERFASVAHAVACMVEVDTYGYRVQSLSDPDRIKRLLAHSWESNGPAGAHSGAAMRQVDDLAPVRAAWAKHARVPLPIYVKRYVERRPLREIVAMLAVGGLPVTTKVLGRELRVTHMALFEYLRERELIPPAHERGKDRQTEARDRSVLEARDRASTLKDRSVT